LISDVAAVCRSACIFIYFKLCRFIKRTHQFFIDSGLYGFPFSSVRRKLYFSYLLNCLVLSFSFLLYIFIFLFFIFILLYIYSIYHLNLYDFVQFSFYFDVVFICRIGSIKASDKIISRFLSLLLPFLISLILYPLCFEYVKACLICAILFSRSICLNSNPKSSDRRIPVVIASLKITCQCNTSVSDSKASNNFIVSSRV